ncbi:MAG: hypothetical protein M3546_17010 [Actinomycetota bacterium]|nr:hypothetical protein [Actinomycetota bacterium]
MTHASTRAPERSETELRDLLDWKRRVFELYAAVRRSSDVPAAWRGWQEVRAELFRTHPQSRLTDRREILHGVSYFEYDPRVRVLAKVRPAEPETLAIGTSHPSSIDFTRFGIASFELDGRS